MWLDHPRPENFDVVMASEPRPAGVDSFDRLAGGRLRRRRHRGRSSVGTSSALHGRRTTSPGPRALGAGLSKGSHGRVIHGTIESRTITVTVEDGPTYVFTR